MFSLSPAMAAALVAKSAAKDKGAVAAKAAAEPVEFDWAAVAKDANGDCGLCGAGYGHSNICPNVPDYIIKDTDDEWQAGRKRESNRKRRLAQQAWLAKAAADKK